MTKTTGKVTFYFVRFNMIKSTRAFQNQDVKKFFKIKINRGYFFVDK